MLVQLRASRAAARATPARRSVALVSAPFGGVDSPSLALGILAASLRRDGHRVDVHPFDLDVVKAFGLETYRWVAEDSGWKLLVGEWLSSREGSDLATYRAFLDEAGEGAWREGLERVDLPRLRRTLDREIERFLRSVDWGRYDVVGFTVMFQQLAASIRLARAIKDAHPHVRVVLGGINLESPMGDAVARRFPFVDAVFSGYADATFPRWVRELPRSGPRVVAPDEKVVLDDLPIATYDEYLDRLRALGLSLRVRPQLPLETSRGCWWGEKHHCIFCGLNGGQMAYQAKSPERVVREVQALRRYGRKLFVVDNILAADAYDELLPRMHAAGATLSLRWSASLKANVTRPKLKKLRDAGIDIINPGIESLSTDILRLMKKGETSIQNLWLLRACREMGMQVEWHLIRGFPGEDPEEYVRMAELVEWIAHLAAPHGCPPITLMRFSPMHARPEAFGLRDVRPHRAYRHAFGFEDADLAYVFEYRAPSSIAPEVYTRPTLDAVNAWRRASSTLRRPRCTVVALAGQRGVLDTRARGRVGLAPPRVHRLSDRQWAALERLDLPLLESTIEREVPRAELEALERERLVVHRDGRWMRLVVFPEEPSVARRWARRAIDSVRRAL